MPYTGTKLNTSCRRVFGGSPPCERPPAWPKQSQSKDGASLRLAAHTAKAQVRPAPLCGFPPEACGNDGAQDKELFSDKLLVRMPHILHSLCVCKKLFGFTTRRHNNFYKIVIEKVALDISPCAATNSDRLDSYRWRRRSRQIND